VANVVIDIAAEFTGNKAFKQADSATTALTKNVKKLAGAVGLAFSTQAIVSFGKAAVKAFAEDEAAALRLNRAVENLGIGFANPAIAKYIANLEKSAGVADDILRPAFQGLLTTTGSLVQSQKLLNDAITISRASGIDLATVTEDLGKGYVGITKGLVKYNTGLTTAELKSKSFNEILGTILKRSAGAAEDYLDTTAYKFDILSVASSNASEIIGGSLVDAFALIGGGTEASDAAAAIETIATALSKIIVQSGRTIGVIPTLIKNLKNLGKNIFFGFAGAQFGVNITPPADKKEEAKLTLTEKKQQELLAKLEKESAKREKERLALLNKQNAAKRLQGVIDKANLALGKGKDVFDLDKIQVAAALTNQAEQLGKATTSAQLLQITNDTARLNVKRSMLELEDAIATKDEASIIAATKKLNADLGILGTLMKQDLKMQDIKSILESLKPKDLINLGNLDAAIAKMIELNKLQGSKNGTAPTAAEAAAAAAAAADGAPVYSIPKNTTDFTLNNPAIFKLIDKMLPSNSYNEQLVTALNAGADLPSAVRGANYQARAEQEYAMFLSQINMGGIAGQSLTSGMAQGLPLSNALSGSRYAAQGAASYGAGATIVVNTGVGDPNAIAEAVDQVLRDAQQRGTLTTIGAFDR
jgi:hypothetical protein